MNRSTKNGKARKKLAEQVNIILRKRSAKAYKKAKNILLSEKIRSNIIQEALRYFMQEWCDVKHPGMLSIACESVGGDPNSVNDIGAALLLLLSSAHIHDDIIDQSKIKGHKPTVFGKFGRDIALLVGDALLFEGLILLHQFCEKLPPSKKRIIIDLAKTAFLEIGGGEAREVVLREKYNLSPEECLKNLTMRAAMAEAVMRIGAVIGDGTEEEIECLGHYGRSLGLLAAIREEFIDIFEPEELKNRYEHECLPLPILYALQNGKKRNRIMCLLQKKRITEEDTYTLADLVLDTEEIQKQKKNMQSLVGKELQQLRSIKQNKEILKLLLNSTLEDL